MIPRLQRQAQNAQAPPQFEYTDKTYTARDIKENEEHNIRHENINHRKQHMTK